jgi:hypothetical protein
MARPDAIETMDIALLIDHDDLVRGSQEWRQRRQRAIEFVVDVVIDEKDGDRQSARL